MLMINSYAKNCSIFPKKTASKISEEATLADIPMVSSGSSKIEYIVLCSCAKKGAGRIVQR